MNRQSVKELFLANLPRNVLRPFLLLVDRMSIKKIFRSQSNEFLILTKLIQDRNKQEIFFTEFGFDPTEFNCSRLSNQGIKGQLFEMNSYKVEIGRKILHKNTSITNRKLLIDDVKHLTAIAKFHIFSIDVDGNDYEFATEALKLKPDVLIVEYNAIFQDKRVKIPYSQNFNRFDYHRNYFGCSLTSLVDLAHRNSYCLAGISNSAVNAFFVPTGLLNPKECMNNLIFGLNQNHIGTQSRSGTRNLNLLYEEIRNYPLEHLENLKFLCPDNRSQLNR